MKAKSSATSYGSCDKAFSLFYAVLQTKVCQCESTLKMTSY